MKCDNCGVEMVLSLAMLTNIEGEGDSGIVKCPKCGRRATSTGFESILGAAIAADAIYEEKQRKKGGPRKKKRGRPRKRKQGASLLGPDGRPITDTSSPASVQCEVCKATFTETDAKKYSARDLVGMEPKVADVDVVAMHSVASGVIMFNNPPNSADDPMWWICSGCIRRCFSQGRRRKSLQMEKAVFGMVTGKPTKKWWQFWK